jgi:hypothetical protein
MEQSMADITLHIDEATTHNERESLRDKLLGLDGVMAAAYHDEKPHLLVIEYDPGTINSMEFINTAKSMELHAELIGL